MVDAQEQQESVAVVRMSRDSIGVNRMTGSIVKGEITAFSENIYHVLVDSTADNLLLQVRPTSNNEKWYKNDGHVMGYSPSINHINWIRDVDYGNSVILHFDKTVLEQKRKKTTCIDMMTGKDLWEIKSNVIYANLKSDFALAYDAESRKNNAIDLQGVDTKTGAIKWTREVDRNYGWRQLLALDSNRIVISASGVHVIDIHNGEGWSYHEQSGKTRFNYWTNTNTLYNISSNLHIDSASIYYASAKEVVRFNYQGEQVWSYPLPKGLASKSTIIDREDDILLINFGYVNSTNGSDKNYGKSFIASLNKASGKLNYLTINGKKSNHVKGWRIVKEKLYIIYPSEAAVYDLVTGHELNRKSIYRPTQGSGAYVMSDQVYRLNERGGITTLYDDGEYPLYFVTDKETLVGLNEELSMTKGTGISDLYYLTYEMDGLRFITRKKNTMVINEEGIVLFDLRLTAGLEVIGDKIYDLDKKTMTILEWSQFAL